jgi:hypothetical protein
MLSLGTSAGEVYRGRNAPQNWVIYQENVFSLR